MSKISWGMYPKVKNTALYFDMLFIFSLSGPAGIKRPLPIQLILLKHTKVRS